MLYVVLYTEQTDVARKLAKDLTVASSIDYAQFYITSSKELAIKYALQEDGVILEAFEFDINKKKKGSK